MTVKEAKAIAKEWVEKKAAEYPDFFGAVYTGSITRMKDHDLLPRTSDIDIKILLDREIGGFAETTTGEFKRIYINYKNVILEPSYGSRKGFLETEHLAPPDVALDPTGEISRIRAEPEKHYKDKAWVLKRCEKTKGAALFWFSGIKNPPSLPGWYNLHIGKLTRFLLGLGWFVQIPCVANMGRTTAKGAYIASRRTLEQYGEHGLYGTFLKILGSNEITGVQARAFQKEFAEANDHADRIHRTPFNGDNVIRDAARPVIVDAALEMINNGYPREAMYWILLMRTRVQNVIENDEPPEDKVRLQGAFQKLVSTMGYETEAAVKSKLEAVEALLPEVMKVAERIAEKTGR